MAVRIEDKFYNQANKLKKHCDSMHRQKPVMDQKGDPVWVCALCGKAQQCKRLNLIIKAMSKTHPKDIDFRELLYQYHRFCEDKE